MHVTCIFMGKHSHCFFFSCRLPNTPYLRPVSRSAQPTTLHGTGTQLLYLPLILIRSSSRKQYCLSRLLYRRGVAVATLVVGGKADSIIPEFIPRPTC